MDDSILYYLVLGAIYVLSKLFGKKKNQDIPSEVDEYQELDSPRPTKKPAPTFEDILKELTGEQTPAFTKEEKEQPLQSVPEPVLATELVDYQKKNIEALEEDDLIDIVPHKPLERKKLHFERDIHFKMEEVGEEEDIGGDIEEMLSDYDGVRRAMVLKEVLDRKY
ncbi:MAG: hypothetical protein ABJQ37_15415 [Reichenbachiella sp.]|uniref:hypothetical protein n=3 Tax=Reichenbachiella sp. TaxID=2184521 RepID=UPI00329A3C88